MFLDNSTWEHLTDYKLIFPVSLFDIFFFCCFRYPHIDSILKQDFEAMKCVFEYLNVSYTLVGTNNYGYYNEADGSFSGAVNEILQKRADVSGKDLRNAVFRIYLFAIHHVSACSLFFSHDRFKAVDFMKMGNPLHYRFVLKKPSTSYTRNIFVLTFTKTVWLATLLILLVFILTIIVILKWETSQENKVG